MKKTLTLLLFLSPLLLNAQAIQMPIDSATGRVTYQEVVKAPGLSKDDLYVRAREWFAKTFVSAQAVIQMDDKPSGKIIGKGLCYGTSAILFTALKFTVFYTVSVTVKDERYRYEISDFYWQYEPDQNQRNPPRIPIDEFAKDPKNKNKQGEYKNTLKSIMATVNTESLKLAKSLKETLVKPPTGAKSKDDF